jgi:CheY-like chemotaxis protein
MTAAPISKGTNILIVDDEQSVSRLLARYLEEEGYACQTAASGATARELLFRNRFDLALCDLDMPGESGLELIRHIKAQYPETGRVMVTSSSDSDTTKEIGNGTGQGLAIARRVVVEKHQGSLTFETEQGKGSTFIVNLPLAISVGV